MAAVEWAGARRVAVGETSLSLVLNWLLRALMAMGGAALAVAAWPVAWGAWEAQKADAIVTDLRFGRPLDAAAVAAGIDAFNRSIVDDPVARHYLDRSELLAGAALTPSLKLSNTDRDALLRRARSDLQVGLANAPVRGIDWLRLAVVRQVLDGPSRDVLPPLFMSIETAPLITQLWQPRLRVILDAWPYLDDQQRSRLADYFVMTWRLAMERPALVAETYRGALVAEIYSPADELIVRYFLRNEPNAQEELTKWIVAYRKK
jgi:hypothetical protein